MTSIASTRPPARRRLSRRERAHAGGMAAFIALLHVVGWGVLLLLVVPGHYRIGAGVFGAGTGLTAYLLGLRHAFDADHIAAIDNTTRKLIAEGKRPLSVGFWFSLGHSTVVVVLTLLLASGIRTLGIDLTDDGSPLRKFGGLIGTVVSGGFLWLLGIVNLVVLAGIVRVFRRMRRGEYDEAALDTHLENRGFLNRILRRTMRAISAPWQIYPVGILFGLGFDTVSEIALLVLAGTSVGAGLPWYAVMCLPVLFAAGMTLLDTIDGSFMNYAYGWALSQPLRKVYYNLTLTGLSVAVALLIGTVELLSVLAEKLGLTGGLWDWVAELDVNRMGFGIAGVFALGWAIAIGVWKLGRLEERWPAPAGAEPVRGEGSDRAG
ncbi:HoxN/HupN/NixA family nickel/cobalt transporter [Amycolatopsis nivea]